MKGMKAHVRDEVFYRMWITKVENYDEYPDSWFHEIYNLDPRPVQDGIKRVLLQESLGKLVNCQYDLILARDMVNDRLHNEISRHLSGNAIDLIDLDNRLRIQQMIRMTIFSALNGGLL